MKSRHFGSPPIPKKHRRKIQLTKPSDVRKLLSRTINELLSDDMNTEKARCIGYISQILLKSMEVDSIEERLSGLEEKIKDGK